MLLRFCGNTPQYASLQTIYDKYKSRGLVILDSPRMSFGKQEPGDNKTIKEFCTASTCDLPNVLKGSG